MDVGKWMEPKGTDVRSYASDPTMERQQPTSTDMFVESLRRLPAADAAGNAMWSSNVLLRDDGARRRKERKWELRWLRVFPQLPVETVEGLAQAILVYKSADVRATSCA